MDYSIEQANKISITNRNVHVKVVLLLKHDIHCFQPNNWFCYQQIGKKKYCEVRGEKKHRSFLFKVTFYASFTHSMDTGLDSEIK